MNPILQQIKTAIYDQCALVISNYKTEAEGQEYHACQFTLNKQHILCRNAKITPKKVGQFVTCWRRNEKGVTELFHEKDVIDFYVINVKYEEKLGQFVFPKSILIAKGIISTEQKEGKRGFRVYPKWDVTNNKQAERTQQWQLNYFFEINDSTDLIQVKGLYSKNHF
ncbi:MepB family protein [Flammeovirga aprica]|uniref:MepB family protein n=1 Tax=Flammeovirga aprica JL-4 TaxID=694437 RepID=A0A7X9S281_9BACT|nr:MepB family protein [Flammeovirga aprica]NME72832.1 MepB family protein [Flammeovirga aprica JL-4]